MSPTRLRDSSLGSGKVHLRRVFGLWLTSFRRTFTVLSLRLFVEGTSEVFPVALLSSFFLPSTVGLRYSLKSDLRLRVLFMYLFLSKFSLITLVTVWEHTPTI